MKLFLTSLLLLSGLSAFAADQIYTPTLRADGATGIKFSLPYKAGIHHGLSSEIKGQVVTDENDQLLSAEFVVPIASLSTNNASRDCHMREALGVDYTNSVFPKEHICNRDNQFPAEGPDSIAYPEILLSFKRFEVAPAVPFPVGVAVETKVQAVFEIHGVKQEIILPLKVLKSVPSVGHSSLQITGKFIIVLTDYGIVVKPFKLGPFEIGVGEKATVEVDLLVNN